MAVYDGHGGDYASSKLKETAHVVLARQPALNTGDVAKAFRDAAKEVDQALIDHAETVIADRKDRARRGRRGTSVGTRRLRRRCGGEGEEAHLSGSTAVMMLIRRKPDQDQESFLRKPKGGGSFAEEDDDEEEETHDIYAASSSFLSVDGDEAGGGGAGAGKSPSLRVASEGSDGDDVVALPDVHVAWTGDCRAILCRGGKAVQLTEDHKATRPDEKARVEAAGGVVDSKGRLGRVLAVS